MKTFCSFHPNRLGTYTVDNTGDGLEVCDECLPRAIAAMLPNGYTYTAHPGTYVRVALTVALQVARNLCEFTWHDRECGMSATHRVHFEDDTVLNLCDEDFHQMTDDAQTGTWHEVAHA